MTCFDITLKFTYERNLQGLQYFANQNETKQNGRLQNV